MNIKLRVNNIHFVGIGGSGMNGIAEVLFNLGYNISGSDITQNSNVIRLKKLGINIYDNHHQNNVKEVDAVVVSSAIDNKNIELKAARKLKIPIVSRAEMLAEVMRFRFGIAVSGTHGKTTTTSLIAHILNKAKLDPTYIIGGIMQAEGVGNYLGGGQFIVAEADESDKSFLRLNPTLSVITNIHKDHMQTYKFNYKKLQQAFINFTSKLPFYGICIVCIDDAGVKEILPKIKRKFVSYGLSQEAEIRAQNIRYNKDITQFDITIPGYNSFEVKTSLLGKHNVQNILAAVAVCTEVGISKKILIRAIESFAGVKRRLDFKGNISLNNKRLKVYDDYAHHPNEIRAVVESIVIAKQRKPIVIFQPHRYSRTEDLFDEFVAVLKTIDNLILLPIYKAGEEPIANISSEDLIKKLKSGYIANDLDDVVNIIKNIAEDDDIVLTLGAGNITRLATQLIDDYGNKK